MSEHEAVRAAGRIDFLLKLLALFALTGWLLVIGKGIILPIILAAISSYILASASSALAQWRGTRWLPAFARRLLLLLLFVAAIGGMAWVIAITAQDMVAKAPGYQANLQALAHTIESQIGLTAEPDWERLKALTIDQIDARAWLSTIAGSFSALAGMVALVVVYTVFLGGERLSFKRKLAAAFPDIRRAAEAERIMGVINRRVGEYLAVKTLCNAILGLLSFIVLWLMGVDYALFWAIIIALLNYIPYIGSFIGVLFPVLLSIAQFGSIRASLLTLAGLIAVQVYTGNFLEPRMIGRRVNQSPFVVLVALAVWSALWGMAGAILAVPLTSILGIVFAAFAPTRPIAVFLSEDVSEFEASTEADDAA